MPTSSRSHSLVGFRSVPTRSQLTLGADGSVETLSPKDGAAWPAKRVGSSLVTAGDALYLWGGRGGKDMGTFSQDEEDIWRFSVGDQTWEMLSTKGDRPEQRSFHVLCVSNVGRLSLPLPQN